METKNGTMRTKRQIWNKFARNKGELNGALSILRTNETTVGTITKMSQAKQFEKSIERRRLFRNIIHLKIFRI